MVKYKLKITKGKTYKDANNKQKLFTNYLYICSNFKAVVTLWGAKADLIHTDITKDEDNFKVLLITSTKVSMYQGKTNTKYITS